MPESQDLFLDTDKLRLCYRDEGDQSHEPVLMIMGLNSQLIHWPQEIVNMLVAKEYRVIRFDNRDSGLTTWKDKPPLGYLLSHMADDAVKLLDRLQISKAHVVGASMGGMIAQRFAIATPAKVQTLCSIMSTTGNDDVGRAEPGVYDQLAGAPPTPPDRAKAIAQIVAAYQRIGSKEYADEELANRQAVAALAYDRGTDAAGTPLHPGGGLRQISAILNAPDRTEDLAKLKIKTLVIHGDEDSLIHISGGRATRNAIPNAQWLTYPNNPAYDGVHGMGHDLPAALHDTIANAIATNMAAATIQPATA